VGESLGVRRQGGWGDQYLSEKCPGGRGGIQASTLSKVKQYQHINMRVQVFPHSHMAVLCNFGVWTEERPGKGRVQEARAGCRRQGEASWHGAGHRAPDNNSWLVGVPLVGVRVPLCWL